MDNMDMDMDHGSMGHQMSYSHMTFFWGTKSEILFSGWPGASGGMYALALALVFALALLIEWLSNCRTLAAAGPGRGRVADGLVRTAMHVARVGLAYLAMLAVMSFNGGVLVAAVAGHALGFLLFGSSVFRREVADGLKPDLPRMAC